MCAITPSLIFIVCICVLSLCGLVHECAIAEETRRGLWILLELESLVVVSDLLWVPGTKLGSLAGAVRGLNHSSSLMVDFEIWSDIAQASLELAR